MSTRFYGYKIKKEHFWKTIQVIRNHYEETHIANMIIKQYAKELEKQIEEGKVDINKALRKMREDEKELEKAINELQGRVFLQVYDWDEKDYIIEPMENGYYFMNAYKKEKWNVKETYYDNRSDFPEEIKEEEEVRKNIAKWTEERYTQHEYFIVSIYEKENWQKKLFDAVVQMIR